MPRWIVYLSRICDKQLTDNIVDLCLIIFIGAIVVLGLNATVAILYLLLLSYKNAILYYDSSGVLLLYCLLVYCSCAGVGLTRDSDLRSSLRATTWCLHICVIGGRLCYPRLRRGRLLGASIRKRGLVFPHHGWWSRSFNCLLKRGRVHLTFWLKGCRGKTTLGRRGTSTFCGRDQHTFPSESRKIYDHHPQQLHSW